MLQELLGTFSALSAANVVPAVVAAALACPLARRRRLRYLGWLVAFILADDFVLLMPLLLNWKVGHWNWIGKVLSILFGLTVAKLCFSAAETGLRLPRSRAAILWSLAAVLGAVAIISVPSILADGSPTNLETIAYEATLPGLDEELAFRGIGLALLLRMFSAGPDDRRARVIALLVTSLWFTAVHVVQLQDGQLLVSWSRVLDVFPVGAWLALVRLRSGSLLGGVLAHNAANTASEIISALKA